MVVPDPAVRQPWRYAIQISRRASGNSLPAWLAALLVFPKSDRIKMEMVTFYFSPGPRWSEGDGAKRPR